MSLSRRCIARAFSTSQVANAAPIKAGLILSRIPIVTPDTPEFDKLFYEYQESLERRLMWTFPKWYYFKKGTVAEREFSEAQKYPIPYHRGVWFPEGSPDLKHGRDRRFAQDVILPRKDTSEDVADADADADIDNIGRPIKTYPRITAADESNDQSSLERKLPRTLYLLIQDNNNNWKFPSFDAIEQDHQKGLHQISEDGLRTIGGDKINSWSVSNSPAAVIKYDTAGKIIDSESPESREFLFKSHIVAGKFELQQNSEIKQFKWLAKEEIAELVDQSYYSKIGHLLSNI